MMFLLDVALRSSVPLAAGLLASLALRRRSAALRHTVLAAATLAAVAVIPLSIVMPVWNVPVPSAVPMAAPAVIEGNAGAVAAVAESSASPAASVAPLRLAFAVWIGGVFIGAIVVLRGMVRLWHLTLRAEVIEEGHWRRLASEIAAQYGITRPIVLLATRASSVLATWGVFRPRVLLPAHAHTWSEDRARIVLCHELAHVRRFDWPVQILAELLRTVFWFNPLLWILSVRLRREGEHACDDAVLGTGVAASTYASHLVEIAKLCREPRSGWVPAMSMARASTLEGRVTAMLNSRVNRETPTWRALVVLGAALVAIVLPMASLEVSAQLAGPRALTGLIYDPSGFVLPAVEVALINDQQVKWSAVTDGTGKFEFAPVGAGDYVLEASLPGFRPLRSELKLVASGDWTRNITMQVSPLQETISVTAKRVPQTARRQATANDAPVRVGGNIKVPMKVKHVAPVYPPAMRDAGLNGIVPMDALIGKDGTVVSVRIVSAQVHPEFARAAEEAVRGWVFTPTLLNGAPVEVQMTVSVQFSLQD